MKDMTPETLFAVFHEMLGPLLWVIVAVAALATIAFVVVLLRDRGFRAARLARAELLGAAGGLGAVLFMQWVTSSGFADIGGPVDVMLVALIFVLGGVGATMLAYAILGLIGRRAA
jgi:hypothetical protein